MLTPPVEIVQYVQAPSTPAYLPYNQVNDMSYEDLLQNSQEFSLRIPFPTSANTIEAFARGDLVKKQEVVQHAKGTRPILHKRTLQLIADFLAFKREYGSTIERAYYSKLDINGFIDRLIMKRPLTFCSEDDIYLLRDGKYGRGGFEQIGTEEEVAPLILKDYLSYDEMQIAALLGVSVPTHFINQGDRENKAVAGAPGTFEEKGVYVALVGARFAEKRSKMECQHIVVDPSQNTSANGYGVQGDLKHPKTKLLQIWAKYYRHLNEAGAPLPFPTYEEWMDNLAGEENAVAYNTYLNKAVYKERLRMVIEPFLSDANLRGVESNQDVFVRATGLGLGVWALDRELQREIMLDVYAEILKENAYPHISAIDFNYFARPQELEKVHCGGVHHGGTLATEQNTIKIYFTCDGQAAKLTGEHAGQLLVAAYAWDGNAYPGNEYWMGVLASSGDPAAICCSMLAELQNPEINPYLSSKALRVYP